jgi:uncharacterized protein YdiU (UPF0061 family)
MNKLENLDLTHSFYQLGTDFYQAKSPDPVSKPFLVNFNPSAAKLIGLDPSEALRKDFVEHFSGNLPLPGSKPLAMVYSGHQFGAYNPRLGDGRGLLLGEVRNGLNETWDIYLKGCGPTRYSRGFDGRATLRSSIREHLGCEALHGLGIPTTRSLAVIGIGDVVYREYPQAGAVLVRLSESHVRFGSFQYFHFNDSPQKITQLADYVVQRHFPELSDASDKYRLLLRAIMDKTARLIAFWQSVGFIHGVMNTDNMAINGVTFDYGPYGFMDRFNPEFTPNASDGHGRYAYGQQAMIAHWNLFKLGETFKHLLDTSIIMEELNAFPSVFDKYHCELMGRKLGLSILDSEFSSLVDTLFALLNENQPDFTLFFRSLSNFPDNFDILRHGFKNPKPLEEWLHAYRRLIEREDCDPDERKRDMDQTNPKFILRNYLLENAIAKVLKDSDYSEVERLRILLSDPYNDHPEIFKQYGIEADFYASETPDQHVEMQLSCSA